jgi:hypothetical protein
VGDRLVLQRLSAAALAQLAAGEILLDDFIYAFVQDELSYRYSVTSDVAIACTVEEMARKGALRAGTPFLNPLPAARRH